MTDRTDNPDPASAPPTPIVSYQWQVASELHPASERAGDRN
ncbi:MAG: hypothetical protein OXC27_18335 [Caldilineaceae bacterium]|nr:hypothetical protein [Caldilineaceae bacterium]